MRDYRWHHRIATIVEDYDYPKEKLKGQFVWVKVEGFDVCLAPVSMLESIA